MVKAPTSERLSWLGSATSLLAVMACYGTLAAVALLSLVGVSVDLSEGLLIKIITGLLVVALLGITYSFWLHRSPGPLVLSVVAAGLLVWVFYGTYSHVLEIVGFGGLVMASIWDFRVKRRACAVKCETRRTTWRSVPWSAER